MIKVDIIKILPKYRSNNANKNVDNSKKRNNKRKTTEQYKDELYNVNPNVEVLGEYINANTKILHRCKLCLKEWYVLPNNLLKGHGCKTCVSTKSHEQYIVDVSKTNPNVKILGRYTGANNKIECQCNICGYK